MSSLAPIALFTSLIAVGYLTISSLLETNSWVTHTHKVIAKASQLEKLIVDLETGKRGYIITGKQSFLEPYNNAITQIDKNLDDLALTVNDNPIQVKQAGEIRLLVNKWLKEAGNVMIDLRKQVGSDATRFENLELIVKEKSGSQIIEQIRKNVDSIILHFREDNDLQGELFSQQFLQSLIGMETSQRRFLVTGSEQFLDPFKQEKIKVQQILNNLKRHASIIEEGHSHGLENLIQSLNVLTNSWLEEIAQTEIKTRYEVNKNQEILISIRKNIENGYGKNIMDSARFKLKEFKDEEYRLLAIRQDNASRTATESLWFIALGCLFTITASSFISFSINRNISQSIRNMVSAVKKIEKGDYLIDLKTNSNDEIGDLSNSINNMTIKLKEKSGLEWVKTNLNEMTKRLQGIDNLTDFASILINELSPTVKGQLGVIYLAKKNEDGEKILSLTASYAYKVRKNISNIFGMGESLVGQCALEKKSITFNNIPSDYITIQSGLGEISPKYITLVPVMFESNVLAVIEIGSIKEFENLHLSFLDQIAAFAGIAMDRIISRRKTEMLLKETESKSKILQDQQEELKVANEELEDQTRKIKKSEKKLIIQAGELQAANEELEEKTENLQRQNKEIEAKRKQITDAKELIEEKAQALARSSKYKSEFLANMSHELRTPLNSLLILSKNLAENRKAHLDSEEVESAQIIHEGGQNLLSLINDILDLAKVEEGKMTVYNEDLNLIELSKRIEKQFLPMAKEKNLELGVSIDTGTPESINTDGQKTEQILRNIIGNALKFTSEGSVKIRIFQPHWEQEIVGGKTIAFEVRDSGSGIPSEKQKEIFEAFKQEDGSTSRKFGGTGLGLSISQKMSVLLGGKVKLQSSKGEGSTFTLLLPMSPPISENQDLEPENKILPINSLVNSKITLDDEGHHIQNVQTVISNTGQNKVMLIIEDDVRFAKILGKVVEEHGFSCIYAHNGIEGLNIAKKKIPHSIILDMNLPGMNGSSVLQNLKFENKTRNIPVQIISASDNVEQFFNKGAFGFLKKPVKESEIKSAMLNLEKEFNTSFKNILLIENDPADQKLITRTIQNQTVKITIAESGKKALILIKNRTFHTIILDLALPDMNGLEFLDVMQEESNKATLPPIIIHTAEALSEDQIEKLEEYSQRIILKGSNSMERLLDETMLFIQSIKPVLGEEQNIKIRNQHVQARFDGEIVLLVDDDMKNTFALSKILRDMGLTVVPAANGKKALEKLDSLEVVDLILMDIMMPAMDGYEATKIIREKPGYEQIPIIALTAKAMPEDRIKCMNAGASDYLSKPVDIDKLLSLIEVWINATETRTTA